MNQPTAREPVAGDLLVASIMLADGVFNQTVVLVLDADEDGALGVILNEISQTPLDAVLPDWVGTVSEPRLLFHGGPVSPNGAICLASVAADGEEPPGWRPLFDSVGLLHLDTPIEIVSGAYRDLRIFAGYAGWASGQLQAEISEGMWHLVPADYSDVFGGQPLELWRTVLRRQQGEIAFFSGGMEQLVRVGQVAFSGNINLPPQLIPPPPNLPQVSPPPAFGQTLKPTSINAGSNTECVVQ